MNWWNTSDLLIVINQRDKELETVQYLARMETKKNQALIEQLKQEKLDLEQFKNKQIKELMIEIKELKAEIADLKDDKLERMIQIDRLG